MYILFTMTVQKYQIENQTPKILNSLFKFICYSYLDSCNKKSILKRRLLNIAKSPVLRDGGNDNSTSRYGNDVKFVMAFLDM